MARILALVVLVSFVLPVLAAEPVSAPPEPEGMKSLFNGKDLTGWDGDPKLWSVKDGAIRGETTPENPAKGNTFLVCQAAAMKDFELRLSFRLNATNNSGIQYRSKHIADAKARNKWVVRGYQHEIRNEIKLPSVAGFIYDEGGKRGRICLVGEKAVWGEDGKKKVTDTLIDQEGFKKLFKLDHIATRMDREPGAEFSRQIELSNEKHFTIKSAVVLANSLENSMLVISTARRLLANYAAHQRPERADIFAFCPDEKIVRALLMNRGVTPFRMDFASQPEESIRIAIDFLKEKGLVETGHPVVIVSDVLNREFDTEAILLRKA